MLKIKALLYFLVSFSCYSGLSQKSITDQSYFYGRNYFVLRSGQAKMVIQSDRADIGPAFTYLLFDADKPGQTAGKERAFNYVDHKGFSASALQVILSNYAFTALGTNTIVRWISYMGIPSVEAVWWASGVKVTEVVTPVYSKGAFKRTITVESADLVARDTIHLRLSLPAPAQLINNGVAVLKNDKASIGLLIENSLPVSVTSSGACLDIGPVILNAAEKKTINTYLFVETAPVDDTEFYSKIMSMEKDIRADIKLTRQLWDKTNMLLTGDSVVENMFNVCRYILPGYVSDNGIMDAGIFEYGNQWVRDASNTALGVISTGNFEIARAIFNNVLKNMITENGTTMIAGGFDQPDKEQFDQMGEFLHAMKSYVDWSGDTSLLNEFKNKIVAMIERPLNNVFRDKTGMVHNRREFWERTFDDAYELAYQTWIIQGLRDAADLSKYLGVAEKAGHWRTVADEIQKAMLTDPKMKLVENGYLIKRRNITGRVADTIRFAGWVPGAPASVEQYSRLMPDATMALPIALGIVDPLSPLAKNTLAELEKLWNRRWSFGGYDRYNTSSQGDQPGPWTFATTFILRAQHAAGQLGLSRRSLNWLYNIEGGKSGAWFEEIPVIKVNNSGILPWTSAEVAYFTVHQLLGVKFAGEQLFLKPALYPETKLLKANLRFRRSRIDLEIRGSGKLLYGIVNGEKIYGDREGVLVIPDNFNGGKILVVNDER